MPISPLDFDKIADLFLDVGSQSSPAELHGFIAGQVIAGKRFSDQELLESCDEYLLPEHGFNVENEQSFVFVYSHLLNSLSSEEFAFYPLLPDETTPIAERLEQFILWCEAYLEGFAAVNGKKALDQQNKEVLADIVAVTQIDTEQETDNSQKTEQYFTEILEYIRIAIIALYTDNAEKPTEAKENSLQNLFKNRQIH